MTRLSAAADTRSVTTTVSQGDEKPAHARRVRPAQRPVVDRGGKGGFEREQRDVEVQLEAGLAQVEQAYRGPQDADEDELPRRQRDERHDERYLDEGDGEGLAPGLDVHRDQLCGGEGRDQAPPGHAGQHRLGARQREQEQEGGDDGERCGERRDRDRPAAHLSTARDHLLPVWHRSSQDRSLGGRQRRHPCGWRRRQRGR
jgi:hypothetical protein